MTFVNENNKVVALRITKISYGSAVPEAEKVFESVMSSNQMSIAEIGRPGKSVLEAPVDIGKVGVVVYAGTNAMAAVEESGIDVVTYPISTVVDFGELRKL